MLCELRIPFTSERGLSYGWSSSSVLHGILMQQLPTEDASLLHEQGLRPFHQTVMRSGDSFEWVISALDQDTCKLLEPLRSLREVYSKQKDDTLHFGEPVQRVLSYDELFKRHYIRTEPSRFASLEFLSPTAFKSAGSYVNLPSPRLILSGLAKRYDMTCHVHETEYERLLETISEQVEISSFKLRSTNFSVEGVRIPAFMGALTLRISGNQTFRSYVHMLCDYAGFSGIGIKTALGMGHIRYTVPEFPAERRDTRNG